MSLDLCAMCPSVIGVDQVSQTLLGFLFTALMCLKPCVVSKITGEVDRCAKLASHYRSGNQTLKTIVIHGQSRIHAPVANRGIQARRSRESARRCRTSDNFLGDLPIIIGTSKGTSIRSIEVAEVGPLSPKQADAPHHSWLLDRASLTP
jgi:hypothetical protein